MISPVGISSTCNAILPVDSQRAEQKPACLSTGSGCSWSQESGLTLGWPLGSASTPAPGDVSGPAPQDTAGTAQVTRGADTSHQKGTLDCKLKSGRLFPPAAPWPGLSCGPLSGVGGQVQCPLPTRAPVLPQAKRIQQWALRLLHVPQLACRPHQQLRPPPRKGQQSFLPSSGKHIYPGQAHPRWPHNGPYQPRSQAQRPCAHTKPHLFPVSTQRVRAGPERPYPDGGQEESEHYPFPFPPLTRFWTHPTLAQQLLFYRPTETPMWVEMELIQTQVLTSFLFLVLPDTIAACVTSGDHATSLSFGFLSAR
nr:uncharacterized protein LOC118973236 [Manis javanica]